MTEGRQRKEMGTNEVLSIITYVQIWRKKATTFDFGRLTLQSYPTALALKPHDVISCFQRHIGSHRRD